MSSRKTGKPGVRAAITAAMEAKPEGTAAPSAAPEFMAGAFEMRKDGLYRKPKDGNDGAMWLCSPFVIEAETRDPESANWGLLFSWHDRDGNRHEEPLSRALFNGECAEVRARLAAGGLTMNSTPAARQAFAQFLNICRSPHRAVCVGRTGWHQLGPHRVFVLPEQVFGAHAERVILQAEERASNLYRSSGTLDQWRSEVSRLCLGNSRLLFAASCGFAAPLLGLLNEDGGGFNLRGGSRIGKSTALRVAASVCGGAPGLGAAGYIRQWRTTANGIEAVADAHSDTLLPLDELGQVDAREASDIAYTLANEQGKFRATRSGSGRPARRFRVLFLSTGEIGLADKNAEANRPTKAGQQVRVADIPADAGAGLGLFEDLHEEVNADGFARELRRVTALRYGTALPAFLSALDMVLRKNPDACIDGLRERVGTLLREWLLGVPQAGGQVRSVGYRFALVGIAGELAAEWLVTEWPPGAAAAAAGVCFRAWLAERGTPGAAEDAQAVRQLRAFVARHGSARFEVWADSVQALPGEPSDPAHPPAERFRTQNRAGWRRWQMLEDSRHGWVYFLTPDGMNEALAGLAFRESVQTLAELGIVLPSRAAADARVGRVAGRHRVPGQGQVRLYELAPSLLGTEDGTD